MYDSSSKPESVQHVYIYIRESRFGGNYRQWQRTRIPVARYGRLPFGRSLHVTVDQNRCRLNLFVVGLASSLESFTPWVPIFVQRRTRQTVIYSNRRKGRVMIKENACKKTTLSILVFVFPAIVNVYGKSYSLAQLIASGYASFESNGARPTSTFDIARYIQPLRCKPYDLKLVDVSCLLVQLLVTGPGIPSIHFLRGGFIGGVYTKYRSFVVPKYPEMVVNDRYDESESDEDSDEESGEDEQEKKNKDEYEDRRPPYRRHTSKRPKTSKRTLPPSGNKKDILH